jgi:hypothetical protein
MIVLRVANGQAYNEHTLSKFSATASGAGHEGRRRLSIEFAPQNTRSTTVNSTMGQQILLQPSHRIALDKENSAVFTSSTTGIAFAPSTSTATVKVGYEDEALA